MGKHKAKKNNRYYYENKRNNQNYYKKEKEIKDFYNDDEEIVEEEVVIEEEPIETEEDFDEEIVEEQEEITEEEDEERDEPVIIEENTINYGDEPIIIDSSEIKNDKHNIIRRVNKIMNIIFVVIIILLVLVSIDVICVSKYNKGPFFAIPVRKYDDGGTKEYYGLGYKVIKYNQVQGRRDKVLGSWKLKYNSEPITIEDLDLAIEFNDNSVKTQEKYYKQFVRIISTLHKVDTKNNKIIIGYNDPDGKYTLNIECKMVKDQNIKKFKTDKEITIIGTVKDYQPKTKKQPNTLYIDNCFAEQ